MTKKTDDKPTKAGAVEIDEKDLDSVQGGLIANKADSFELTEFTIKSENLSPRLTDNKLGVRKDAFSAVRATDGTKLRK